MSGTKLPLVDRPAASVLFRTPAGAVTAIRFLAEAAALAGALPAHAHVANLCQDRYAFVRGLVAALLRGQVSLLSADPSPGVLARLAAQFPDSYALTDAAAADGSVPDTLPLFQVPTTLDRADDPGDFSVAAEQPAIVVLTSGSTGEPVATRKNWGELVARSRAAGVAFALDEARPATVLGTVPPGHMYGLETTVLLPLHAAVGSWCGPAFFPTDVAAALDALPAPCILVTTPVHLRALLDGAAPRRPPERVISATAPLDPAAAGDAERAWHCEVLEIFGASEVGSIARRRTVSDAHWTLYPDVRIVPGDGDALFLQAPHAEPRRLNDRLAVTEDGRGFTLLGRATDVVKLGGRRASLTGLTQALLALPGVQDGVFLVPDELDGAPTPRLAAFAVAPGQTAAELLQVLRAEIDPLFLPRPLILLDALPRDRLGKLPRSTLLALLDRGSRIDTNLHSSQPSA